MRWLGEPLQILEIPDAERSKLSRLARRRNAAQALVLRAEIVLRCADGALNFEVGDELGKSFATVGKRRERFRIKRLNGLTDAPRSGPPRTVDDARVEEIITKTLTSQPKGSTHWSSRELAAETGLSQSTISHTWRTFGLEAHRSDSFKFSTGPIFIEKTRDNIGLYMSPPESAIVSKPTKSRRSRRLIERLRSSQRGRAAKGDAVGCVMAGA